MQFIYEQKKKSGYLADFSYSVLRKTKLFRTYIYWFISTPLTLILEIEYLSRWGSIVDKILS